MNINVAHNRDCSVEANGQASNDHLASTKRSRTKPRNGNSVTGTRVMARLSAPQKQRRDDVEPSAAPVAAAAATEEELAIREAMSYQCCWLTFGLAQGRQRERRVHAQLNSSSIEFTCSFEANAFFSFANLCIYLAVCVSVHFPVRGSENPRIHTNLPISHHTLINMHNNTLAKTCRPTTSVVVYSGYRHATFLERSQYIRSDETGNN